MSANTSNHRRPLRIACRIITFLISLSFFAVDLRRKTAKMTMMITPTQTTTSVPSATVVTSSNNNTTAPFSSTLQEYLSLTNPSPALTLTHYDPHLLGGFRNQHMRFVALIHKAVTHNISQILLPSLRWGDVSQPGKSVGHEVLFDVVYWNRRAGEFGLPQLVRYDKNVLEKKKSSNTDNNDDKEEVVACFNATSNMYSGLNENKWRSKGITLRQYSIWDYLGSDEKYAHCKYTFDDIMSSSSSSSSTDLRTHLVPHGGTKQAGRLWWEYFGLQSHRGNRDVGTGKYPDHLPLEQAIYKLLIPSEPIRSAIRESLDEAMVGGSSIMNRPTVVALHPRIEHDMLLHKVCSKFMEPNLTKIFDESIRIMPKFDLLFVAVSVDVDGLDREDLKLLEARVYYEYDNQPL